MHSGCIKNKDFLFFILLYPGFFFYNFINGTGLARINFGGWFSFVLFFYFISYVFSFFYKRKVIFFSPLLVIFILLVAWMLIISLFNFAISGFSESVAKNLLYYTSTSVFQYAGLFILGANFKELKNWQYKVCFFILVIQFFLIIQNISTHLMFSYIVKYSPTNEGMVSSYQGMARSVLILLFVLFSHYDKIVSKVLIGVLGTIMLFLIGARTQLIAWLIILYADILLFSNRKIKFYFMILTVCSVLYIQINTNLLGSSRIFQLFSIENSSSYNSRYDMFQKGMNAIINSPFFGDYGGQVRDGSGGAYIHNFLSSWRQFGIVGFLLYILFLLCIAFQAVKTVILAASPMKKLAFYMTLYVLFVVCFSEPIFWPDPGLAAGMLYAIWRQSRLDNQKPAHFF